MRVAIDPNKLRQIKIPKELIGQAVLMVPDDWEIQDYDCEGLTSMHFISRVTELKHPFVLDLRGEVGEK